MSENAELVKYVAWVDAENTKTAMCNQKNFKGKVPIDYDAKKVFYDTVYHIWGACCFKQQIERVENLIKNGTYTINQQTIKGGNTPLHFAVIHENIKCIAKLSMNPTINKEIKNGEGLVPIDYAYFIPKKSYQY